MRDSASISFVDPDGRTVSSELVLSDIVSLRDFAGCMGDSTWSMDSEGTVWTMEAKGGVLTVACVRDGIPMEADFPRGCAYDLFRALERRWGGCRWPV